MNSFFYNLKGQATIFNGLIILFVVAFLFYRYQKRKIAIFLVVFSTLLFLLCSTDYLPGYLAYKLESRYPPMVVPPNIQDTGRVLIHILGSGYTFDKRLPPNAQLGMVAVGRLAEGIRLHRLVKNSLIICSGYSPVLGTESQAQVTRNAALDLGVNAAALEILNEPTTTLEEARDLAKRFDKRSKLIIVTDALHMDRAIRIFTTAGFHPLAAPTNYKIKKSPVSHNMKWWPSMGNIWLMDYLIHEYLGGLKAAIRRR